MHKEFIFLRVISSARCRKHRNPLKQHYPYRHPVRVTSRQTDEFVWIKEMPFGYVSGLLLLSWLLPSVLPYRLSPAVCSPLIRQHTSSVIGMFSMFSFGNFMDKERCTHSFNDHIRSFNDFLRCLSLAHHDAGRMVAAVRASCR